MYLTVINHNYLGCVIFTLLSGKPAFEYTTMRDTYKRIVKLQYKIPDQLTPAGILSFVTSTYTLDAFNL